MIRVASTGQPLCDTINELFELRLRSRIEIFFSFSQRVDLILIDVQRWVLSKRLLNGFTLSALYVLCGVNNAIMFYRVVAAKG